MKIVIIGNGVAGQTVAETIRKEDQKCKISLVSQESFPFYTRIYLPHYIANQRSLDRIILKNREWYKDNQIDLFLNSEVTKINRKEKIISIKTRFQKIINNQTKLFC